MHQFSKFLAGDEVAVKIAYRREKYLLFYLLIFTGLPLVFFLLYPLLNFGRDGLIWWLALVFLVLILAIKQGNGQKHFYLLTNRRLLEIRPQGKEYKIIGQVKWRQIKRVAKAGRENICLFTPHHKYYLTNLISQAAVFQILQKELARNKRDFLV